MAGHWQRERMWSLPEGAIHMVTFWEGAYKASGSFEAGRPHIANLPVEVLGLHRRQLPGPERQDSYRG
eukprot:1141607-Pelagomonas_calceolata.AAC.1